MDDSEEEAFTKVQIEEFREVFNIFDKTNNGYITKKDINTVLRSLGQELSEEEMEIMFENIERENDGEDYGDNVYFRDFLKIIARKVGGKDSNRDFIDAFQVFDRDSTGALSTQELRSLFGMDISAELDGELDEFFKEADENSDGLIEYDKYLSMIMDCFK